MKRLCAALWLALAPSTVSAQVDRDAINDFIVGLQRSPREALIVRKFGYNLDIDDTQEDIVSQGGSLVYPSAAAAMVVSFSGNDASNGTHARAIRIWYHDTNFERQQVDQSLTAGGSPITMTQTAWRVDRVKVIEVGAYGNTNENAISVSLGGNVQAQIPAGTGQTQKAAFSVPSNMVAYLYCAIVSMDRNLTSQKSADIALWVREDATNTASPAPWRKIYALEGYTAPGPSPIPFKGAVEIPGGTDLRWTGVSTAAANVQITVDFTLVMFRTDVPVGWP